MRAASESIAAIGGLPSRRINQSALYFDSSRTSERDPDCGHALTKLGVVLLIDHAGYIMEVSTPDSCRLAKGDGGPGGRHPPSVPRELGWARVGLVPRFVYAGRLTNRTFQGDTVNKSHVGCVLLYCGTLAACAQTLPLPPPHPHASIGDFTDHVLEPLALRYADEKISQAMADQSWPGHQTLYPNARRRPCGTPVGGQADQRHHRISESTTGRGAGLVGNSTHPAEA